MFKLLITCCLSLGLVSCTALTPNTVKISADIHSLTYKPVNKINLNIPEESSNTNIYQPVYRDVGKNMETHQAWSNKRK